MGSPQSSHVQDWPSVTAVVPTRDRPELVRRAVQLILDQDYPGEVECVVVFDQCEPHPVDVRTGPRRSVRAIRNERTPGLAGARNSGVVASRSDLVAFCDDDDEWLPGKLSAQVALLAQHPRAPMVACGILVNFRDRDAVRLAPVEPVTVAHLLQDRVMEVNPCTALIRRDVMVDAIGLVDEEIPGGYGEDYEWLLRAAAAGAIPSVPAPLVRVNWHQASFFADRYRTIIAALHYLTDKYPQFQGSPRGLARIEGQLAFAHAGLGERRDALRWAGRSVRHHWREQRAYAALVVTTGLLSAERVVSLAHRAGRGI
ncbi:MAG: glycosyltransferase family 2 protein [Angustibacter sp.]